MNIVPRSRQVRVLLSVCGLAALAAATVAGFSIMKIATSSRNDVGLETLAMIEVSDLGPRFERGWSEDTSGFNGEAYVRTWLSDRSESLMVAVWKQGDPLRAEWVFYSNNEKINYRSDFPGLVREVAVPEELNADNADLFCGNVGRSRTDEFEDCQIWGFWARYGQYVLYLDLYGGIMTANAFKDAVLSFDRQIAFLLD